MFSFSIAWRSLWRNKRRSLLTVSSIAVGLAAVMFGQSLLRSFQGQMIEKATGIQLGHLQVQARSVQDRKVPETLLSHPDATRRALEADPRVECAATRLLFTGLAYSATASRGVLILGVEPESEKRISILPRYLKTGRYLGGSPRDAVMGVRLARDLDLRLGERLVVMAQKPDGEMNSELFRVAGIYETGSTSYDGQAVYVPIEAARRLRDRPGMASHVALRLKDLRDLEPFARERGGSLGDPEAVLLTYRQVGSEITGIKKFQDALLVVVLIIIFSIVGLGILNTISMSFFERIREFGIVRAIGARPGVVFRLLVAEAALLGAFGAGAGFLLGIGIISFFAAYGLELPLGRAMSYFMPFDNIIYMRPMWAMHAWSALGVFGVSVLTAVPPALRAARLVVTNALKHI